MAARYILLLATAVSGKPQSYYTVGQPAILPVAYPQAIQAYPQPAPHIRQAVRQAVPASLNTAANPTAYSTGSNYKYEYKYNPDAQYKYDINNPKPFVYEYKYDPSAVPAIPINADPLFLVDSAIAQTRASGKKVSESLKLITDNKLVKQLLDSSDATSDPCSKLPTNLDSTVDGLVEGIAGSRNELATIFAAVQKMQANRNNPSLAIRAISEAVSSFTPLLPRLAGSFQLNDGCAESLDAVSKKYNTAGDLMSGLGLTNILTEDEYADFQQGGQTSKTLGRIAGNLGRSNFENLCVENANLPKDVFTGVADILDGLTEIVGTFDGNPRDINEISSTAALLKDGAVSKQYYIMIKYNIICYDFFTLMSGL